MSNIFSSKYRPTTGRLNASRLVRARFPVYSNYSDYAFSPPNRTLTVCVAIDPVFGGFF